MTNQQTTQQQCSQHREDYRVQKLIRQIEAKLTTKGKAERERAAQSKN